MFGGHDWSASGMSNCEMCDYGGIGRCCRENDNDYGSNDDEPVHARQPTKTIKTACARPAEPAKTTFVIADPKPTPTPEPPAERLYTQDEVKSMIDAAVAQYVDRCDRYKNEMLRMMQASTSQHIAPR